MSNKEKERLTNSSINISCKKFALKIWILNKEKIKSAKNNKVKINLMINNSLNFKGK